MPPGLQVRELEVRYGPRVALSDVSIDVEVGQALAVIGPNGSGKSTLLKAIVGISEPTSGTVSTTGRPALVLQSTDVDRNVPISVRDTVSMARYSSLGLMRPFRASDRAAVEEAMERMAVEDLARRQLHDLSGGQRQRVLVAQGLAQDATVLLLDEPVTGLDLVSQQRILDVIDEERSAGRCVVITTHDLDEARRCDQVLLLDTEPIAIGPPDDVLTEEHLQRAFGGRFVRMGDDMLLDDPHHHHDVDSGSH